MKLLVCGDVHIGRASSRVPESIARDQIWTVRAWHALVDLAVAEKVDLLCLTGDIADQDNRFWEAIGPLEQGIGAAAASGIRTVAVAGNHDHDVLGRLADSLDPNLRDHFTLLGRGGTWQRETIRRDGRSVLHIDGWSFPDRYVDRSPLDDYALPAVGDAPVLGMVHGDLDDPNSRYAPLDLAQLRRFEVAGWLLGHVHAPRLEKSPGRASVLYPGSPQAMDPGEPGVHGAWLVEVGADGVASCELKPLSSVRYHEVTVDLDDIDDDPTLQSTLVEAVRSEAVRLVEPCGEQLLVLSLRLKLVGSTALSGRLTQLCGDLAGELDLAVGAVRVGIEKIVYQTTPVIDLAAHANGRTAVSALARLLLALEQNDTEQEIAQVIGLAEQKVRQMRSRRDFVELPEADACDQRATRDMLKAQARSLLGELLGQVS